MALSEKKISGFFSIFFCGCKHTNLSTCLNTLQRYKLIFENEKIL